MHLKASRPKILAYWVSGPDHRQPDTRQYQQLRTNAAAREIVLAKDERYLPGAYRLVTAMFIVPAFSQPLYLPGPPSGITPSTALGGWVKSNKLPTFPDVTLYVGLFDVILLLLYVAPRTSYFEKIHVTFKEVSGFMSKFSMAPGCRFPMRLYQMFAGSFVAIVSIVAPDAEGSSFSCQSFV